MVTALLAAWCTLATAQQPHDTLVVCPAEFREALEPWLEHRRRQGHRLSVTSPAPSAEALRDRIRRQAGHGGLRYLVLVGDVQQRAAAGRSIPAHYTRAEVNVRFGSTEEIATDNAYADLDGDRLPDLAVGRLTCDTADELRLMVAKILSYERSADFGAWRRSVHFVAGLGGFGPVADSVLEAAAKSLIGQGIPPAYATTMTYGSWQSPYCPDPRTFRNVTLERLNEGSLFWVYLGHGQQRTVDDVLVPGGRYPILSADDVALLACAHGAPIACLLACFSGAYDLPRDCLAEELLAAPGGPVAVLCGSRVTMPYGMTVLGSELLAECFGEAPPTLGAALVAAKRRTMTPSKPGGYRAALDAVAKVISPNPAELEAERAEHLDLFNLLGDPLLRVAFPQPIEVTVAPAATAGETIDLSLTTPLAGSGVLELAVERGRLTFKPPRRKQFDAAELAAYTDIYRQANEPCLAAQAIKLPAGTSKLQLAVPSAARGRCHVRVFLSAAAGCAAGAADLRIDAKRAEASTEVRAARVRNATR